MTEDSDEIFTPAEIAAIEQALDPIVNYEPEQEMGRDQQEKNPSIPGQLSVTEMIETIERREERRVVNLEKAYVAARDALLKIIQTGFSNETERVKEIAMDALDTITTIWDGESDRQ